MLTLTEKATAKVKEAIASVGQDELPAGIRVSVVDGGCSGLQYAMKLETSKQPEDQLIHGDGFQLFVDRQSLAYLAGTEIDYVETLQGSGFKFKNPNVKSTCGCGESFQA